MSDRGSPSARRHLVHLDTDIGSDVDDTIALATLLGSPEVDLLSITTVYGDTTLRARIARHLLDLAGAPDVPIIAGATTTRSGRPVWWPGHEGTAYDLASLHVWDPPAGAAQHIVRLAAAHPHQIDVVAIGPLTNIADALTIDPALANNLRSIHLMGGAFDRSGPEHNILSDTDAADTVFRSGARIVITPVDVTRRIRLDAAAVAAIRQAGTLGAAIAGEIDQWSERNGELSIPHDATAVLSLLRPDLFKTRAATTDVARRTSEAAGEGETTLKPLAASDTAVVVAADTPAVRAEIVDRVRRSVPTPG